MTTTPYIPFKELPDEAQTLISNLLSDRQEMLGTFLVARYNLALQYARREMNRFPERPDESYMHHYACLLLVAQLKRESTIRTRE